MTWTREQEIIALYLYCRIPFSKANNSNKEIQDMAELLGRSTNSVKMKIGNFGSFDPELKRRGIVGLDGTSQLDEAIWEEYYGHWDKLAFDAQALLAQYRGQTIEQVAEIDFATLPIGEERELAVRCRINQTFFRKAVLSSYTNQCCITGMQEPQLLEAAHIVSWAEDEANRTNPQNGLCMNALMHTAYDRLLLSVTPDYTICVSQQLLESEKRNDRHIDLFRKVVGQKIIKPNRFLPDPDFLAQQYEKYQRAN